MSSGSNSNIPVKKEGGHPGKSIWLLWRTLFEIDNHYTPIKPIGKGAYGVVCSAKNALSGEKVAIKKITNAFENVTDSRRTLREITLLRYLKHENIIAVRDILRPPSRDLFHDVYLVYELMDTDLHQIIRSPQDLTDDHCQYFIYQVLRGLKYVHSANVLHRDLKPSNLLLNSECLMKVCDFGLARSLLEYRAEGEDSAAESPVMTDYVATRWYRAPEILAGSNSYGTAVDLWSLGCIFGEMLGGKPVFPGTSTLDQVCVLHACAACVCAVRVGMACPPAAAAREGGPHLASPTLLLPVLSPARALTRCDTPPSWLPLGSSKRLATAWARPTSQIWPASTRALRWRCSTRWPSPRTRSAPRSAATPPLTSVRRRPPAPPSSTRRRRGASSSRRPRRATRRLSCCVR